MDWWPKRNKNWYFAAFLAVFLVLVLVCCFYHPVVYGLYAYVAVAAIFLTPEQLLALAVGQRAFWALDVYFGSISAYCLLLLFLHYLVLVCKKEQRVNWFSLSALVLFAVYVLLPWHNTSLGKGLFYLVDFALLYLTWEMRGRLQLTPVVLGVCYLVLASAVLGWWVNAPMLLPRARIRHRLEILRWTGLTPHPNNLGILLVLALTGLGVIFLQKKLHWAHFFALYAAIFCLGYRTVSRNFLLCTGVVLVFWAVYLLITQRAAALKILVPLVAIVAGVCLIFLPVTRAYLDALPDPLVDNSPAQVSTQKVEFREPHNWDDVFAGEEVYDPGRSGLLRLYWQDYTSSAKVIFFGRGVAQPYIGRYNPHNLFLRFLWENGLVGVILFLAMCLGAVDWRHLPRRVPWQRWYYLAALLVPMLILMFFEAPIASNFYVVSFVILFLGQPSTNENQVDQPAQSSL